MRTLLIVFEVAFLWYTNNVFDEGYNVIQKETHHTGVRIREFGVDCDEI